MAQGVGGKEQAKSAKPLNLSAQNNNVRTGTKRPRRERKNERSAAINVMPSTTTTIYDRNHHEDLMYAKEQVSSRGGGSWKLDGMGLFFSGVCVSV